MFFLSPEKFPDLPGIYLAAGPGPMVGRHVLNTGCGVLYTDRWPEPHLVFARAGNNMALAGETGAVSAEALRTVIVPGVLEADRGFEKLLRSAVDDLKIWERVIYRYREKRPAPKVDGFSFRRLAAGDRKFLESLSPAIQWIWNTWENPARLAERGFAWGAWHDGRLVSVACSFFVGAAHEDMGVVTEPEYRGKGLSPACVGYLSADILARGRLPSWSTSVANTASQRVAVKSGFSLDRRDFLFVVDSEIPE